MLRAARAVLALSAVAALALAALGVLYLAHKPTKKQWFWSFYRDEPSVAEIFAHNLEVSGGAERLAQLRSFKAEGRFNFNGGEAARAAAAAGGQVTFLLHAKEPDRVEMEVNLGPPEKDSEEAWRQDYFNNTVAGRYGAFAPARPRVRVSIRRGFDGKKGWEYMERTTLTPGSTIPIKQSSSRELDGEELQKMKHYSRTTGLVHLADAYKGLRLTGHELVKWATQGMAPYEPDAVKPGREAYVVTGVNGEGKNETFYFDIETGLLLRMDFEADDAEGETVKVECHFDDYKEVGELKLQLPHRLRLRRGAESATMTFEKYVPNDPIPDSTFRMPE